MIQSRAKIRMPGIKFDGTGSSEWPQIQLVEKILEAVRGVIWTEAADAAQDKETWIVRSMR